MMCLSARVHPTKETPSGCGEAVKTKATYGCGTAVNMSATDGVSELDGPHRLAAAEELERHSHLPAEHVRALSYCVSAGTHALPGWNRIETDRPWDGSLLLVTADGQYETSAKRSI